MQFIYTNMNRTLILLATVVALLMGSPLCAQQKLILGPRLGVSVNSLSPTDAGALLFEEPLGSSTSRVGFHGAFSMRYEVSRYVALGGEVGIAGRGFSQDFVGTVATNNTARFRNTYLELPALVHLQTGKGPVRGRVFGGFQVGFLLESTATGDFGNLFLVSGFQDVDYGPVIGAGVDFRRPRRYFSLEARYVHGLANVFEGTTTEEYFNRMFSFQLGFGGILGGGRRR